MRWFTVTHGWTHSRGPVLVPRVSARPIRAFWVIRGPIDSARGPLMKTHQRPSARGPFPTDAQHYRDHDPDVPDGVETPVVESPVPAGPTPAEIDRPTPLSGSDGPRPGVSAPGWSRSEPAERRRAGGAPSSPLQDGSRHGTRPTIVPGRARRFGQPLRTVPAWWQLVVVVAGGGVGAGLGYRVGRSRLGRAPRARAGGATWA
jgi:hypothetical protein